MEPSSIENVCNLLARSKLLTADEVRNLREHGWKEAKDAAADVGKFGKWLVAKKFLTEYQLGLAHGRQGRALFLSEYKLLDRLGQGRMAGIYEAVHQLGQRCGYQGAAAVQGQATPRRSGRFQREARLAQSGSNTPMWFAPIRCAERWVHYIVMEYLFDGETLEESPRRANLPGGGSRPHHSSGITRLATPPRRGHGSPRPEAGQPDAGTSTSAGRAGYHPASYCQNPGHGTWTGLVR